MNYNESNFTYLKATSLSEYYTELVRAECACEEFPRFTKIKVRKVLEAFLRKIALSYEINCNDSTGNMIKVLRIHNDLSLPEEIYDYMQIIRVNGIGITLYRSRDKRVDKHPIEILELMHRIFCWYLNKREKDAISKFVDLSFKAPKTIEFEKNELKKVKKDLLLKENQINNLREKIIELAQQSKSVGELNNIIIAIKEEKSDLEKIQLFLINKINSHKYEVKKVKEDYEHEIKQFDLVKDECIENHRLLATKESLLVRAELDNQHIKTIINELEETDELIDIKESILESQLESIRNSYEKSLELTNSYQDNSETVEFTYDCELKKKLSSRKAEIKTELSFEDEFYYEKISEYTKLVEEVKKKVVLFRGILNEKIDKSIKYNDFYNAFLNLRGNKLRLIYSIISNWNRNNSNILSKPKEWILNRNSEDSFMESIHKTLEELRTVSDDQIKLSLYYKLVRLAKIPLKNICNRKNFIETIDGMVDSAYNILMLNKEFNYYLSKTHSIKVQYLKKIIENLKNRYKNIKISDYLLLKIYDNIMKLTIENEVFFYESLRLDITNEHLVKNSIRKQPFEFLLIIIEIGDSNDYEVVYNMIFEFLKEITVGSNSEISGEELSLEKFLTGSFRIMLFISSGEAITGKFIEELLPIFIGEVIVSDSVRLSKRVDYNSYSRMIEVLKSKQSVYKDKIIEKNDMGLELENLIKDKSELEKNIRNINHEEEILNQKYESYKEEFKMIIYNSEKSHYLESYEKYKEFLEKKSESDNKSSINSDSSIIEAWVEQASRKINDSNLIQAELKLIEEAKESYYFKQEYKVFEDMENIKREVSDDLHNNRMLLKEKEKVISSIESKIEKINEQLNTLKEIYPDIEL